MIEPSPPFADGARDTGGRFKPGNPGGPGNPLAARVARLRAALLDAVSPDDVRAVVEALVAEAKRGSVPAARELLQRALGAPEALDLAERLEALEALMERVQQEDAR